MVLVAKSVVLNGSTTCEEQPAHVLDLGVALGQSLLQTRGRWNAMDGCNSIAVECSTDSGHERP